MLVEMKVKLKGVCPILFHNGQLANPFYKWTRELSKLTGKRQKTLDDHEKISDVEFMGSLCMENDKFVIPGEYIEAMLLAAAKKDKKGPIAKAAIFCPESFTLKKFDGPETVEGRLKKEECRDMRLVVIQGKRILRTRPKFTNWEAVGYVTYEESQLNEDLMVKFFEVAGQGIGVGDYRPKYGRFEVEFL
jgi:hypothetical protein